LSQILWQPSQAQIDASNMTRLMQLLAAKHGVDLDDYVSLHRYSVAHMDDFWRAVVGYADVIGDGFDGPVIKHPDRMPGAMFFPGASLNYAENLLRHRGAGDAIVFRGEDKASARLSHDDLYAQVSKLAQALRALGLSPGDRVCGYLPNLPETIVAMLALAGLCVAHKTDRPIQIPREGSFRC